MVVVSNKTEVTFEVEKIVSSFFILLTEAANSSRLHEVGGFLLFFKNTSGSVPLREDEVSTL